MQLHDEAVALASLCSADLRSRGGDPTDWRWLEKRLDELEADLLSTYAWVADLRGRIAELRALDLARSEPPMDEESDADVADTRWSAQGHRLSRAEVDALGIRARVGATFESCLLDIHPGQYRVVELIEDGGVRVERISWKRPTKS